MMRDYVKPELQYVTLSAEENFASGSTCVTYGACPGCATA